MGAVSSPARPDVGGRHGGLTLGAAVAVGFTVWGVLIGLRPLGDNSFLTHLATGRLIVEHASVPRTDPFSFTAPDHAWVVQSWLATTVYGLLDRFGGGGALVAFHAALIGLLAWLATRLVRPARSLVTRVLVLGVAVAIGSGMWVERPLLLGLVVLALTLLVVEGEVSPRWLLPLFWVWTNAHGSFPLGLVALAVVAVGRRLDGERPDRELTALRWAAAGVALAVINPLGPRLLLFPLQLLTRGDILSHVVEWQAPRFTGVVRW